MKVLVLSAVTLLATVCMVSAEPPRRRGNYAAPAPAPTEAPAAPYPPSGWRPSGRQFNLPTKQAPQEKYGAPTPAPPPVEVYGPPATEAATTTVQPTTTEMIPETTEATTDLPEEDASATADATAVSEQLKSGVYYVLLPDGRLQRVAYTTSRNQQQAFEQLNVAPRPINPGYLAIQYQDVQPIQGPIYSYGGPFVNVVNQ